MQNKRYREKRDTNTQIKTHIQKGSQNTSEQTKKLNVDNIKLLTSS